MYSFTDYLIYISVQLVEEGEKTKRGTVDEGFHFSFVW
jgi:hypothetical protein